MENHTISENNEWAYHEIKEAEPVQVRWASSDEAELWWWSSSSGLAEHLPK